MTALRRLAALVAALGLLATSGCSNVYGYGDCFHYTAIDATFHCSEFFCPGCPYSGYCDELCGFCGEYGACCGLPRRRGAVGLHRRRALRRRHALYDGKTVDFDCPAFGCDGGDCPSASECGTDAPTPSGPRERDVYAATIEEIQRRATLDFEDDDGDDASIVFDCSRSVLSHRVVRVSGVVSAVAGTGFYFQDGVGPWSGLFAHAGRRGRPVLAARRRRRGRRRLRRRAPGPDAGRGRGRRRLRRGRRRADGALRAVDAATATLALYRRRERDDVDGARCPDAGEPYEGVLVRVSDVALSGSADAFGRVAADDGSGGTLLDSSSAFDTAAYLAALVRPHDGCRSGAIWEPPRQDWDDYGLTSGDALCDYGGVVLASVTGVARYAWKCATPQDHLACLAGGARMDFTFAVAPRHPRPLAGARASTAPDDGAAPAFDCGPSQYEGATVALSAAASATDSFGFYMQDGAARHGGVYVALLARAVHGVATASGAPLALADLGPGDAATLVGLVVESMGSTVLEAVDVVVTGSGTLEALAIRSGTSAAASATSGLGLLLGGEGLESLLVAVDDVDVAVYDGADYCPTCLGRLPFDDGSGAALLDDALYAGGVLERDVTERTVFGDGVSTAPLAALTGVVRYAYACENREDPVYCLSRGAGLGFAKPVGARVDPGMALPQHQIEIPVAQARVVPDAAEAPDDGVPLADARPRRRDPSQMTFRIRLRDGPRPPAPAPRAVSEGAAPPPPDRSAPPEATAVFDDPATVAEPVPVDGFAYTYIIRGLRRPPRSPRPDEAPAPESSEAARHAPPPALAGPPPRSPEPEEPAEEAKDESGGPRPRAPAFASADEEKADEEVARGEGACEASLSESGCLWRSRPPHGATTLSFAASADAAALDSEAALEAAAPPAESERPHILFVIADQHRHDAIGGGLMPAGLTPALDRLRREGATFASHYTSTPSCTPSRAAILTGRKPWHHGMLGFGDIALTYPYAELPRCLARVGYATVSVGKNHFYNEMSGGENPGHGFAKRYTYDGIIAEFDSYDRWFNASLPGRDPLATGIAEFGEELARRLPRRPTPTTSNSTRRPGVDGWDAQFAQGRNYTDLPYGGAPDVAMFCGDIGAKHVRKTRGAYLASVAFVDEHLGLMLDELDALGMADRTFVLYVGDHGDMQGDHHLWRKGFPFEGSAHVPLIVRWPEAYVPLSASRGVALAFVTEHRDLLPTFLDAAGAAGSLEPREAVDGRSLLDLLRGDNATWRSWVDLEHDPGTLGRLVAHFEDEKRGDAWVKDGVLQRRTGSILYSPFYPADVPGRAFDGAPRAT
ncbi:sulfuric ester hydrolase [Aureococcus anophagefferens]|nr:sulfuric ester hydrolase [Aureococcus anophagefferens]